MSMPKNDLENIWKYIKFPSDPKDCWIWIGGMMGKRYGTFCFMLKQHQAHRFVYELLVGKVPKGKELDHLCREKKCVNPDHLEPVRHKINCSRGKVNQNKNKTHCKNGHEFTEKNTYHFRNFRQCRKCEIKRKAILYLKNKLKIKKKYQENRIKQKVAILIE